MRERRETGDVGHLGDVVSAFLQQLSRPVKLVGAEESVRTVAGQCLDLVVQFRTADAHRLGNTHCVEFRIT